MVGLTLLSAGGTAAQFADPFHPVIAGRAVQCMSAIGQPVAFIPNPMLNDIGRSRPGMPPTIELNPVILSRLPPPQQLFWWGHECAHHALGHTIGLLDITSESQADCWAIQKGKEAGILSRRDVEAFMPYFLGNPGTMWGHLPGPVRVNAFLACFDRARTAHTPRPANNSCRHARDGECDEPDLCAPGTDTADCSSHSASIQGRAPGPDGPPLPRFCCTPVGKLGPYPNPGANGIPVMAGAPCTGNALMGPAMGQACF